MITLGYVGQRINDLLAIVTMGINSPGMEWPKSDKEVCYEVCGWLSVICF